MMRALKSLIAEQFPNKFDRSAPSSEHLSAIADMSHGDIRIAINTLQFLCLKPLIPPPPDVVGRRKNANESKRKEETPKCLASDEAIGTREPILSMFHALGKILRNKRIPKGNALADEKTLAAKTNKNDVKEAMFLPRGNDKRWELRKHLKMHERLEMAINPEKVMESISTEPEMFSLYLHQNYLDYTTEVEECVMGTEWFSCADALVGAGGWRHACHLLPYASLITARGVMHSQLTEKESRFQQSYKPELFDMSRSLRANCGKFRKVREELVRREIENASGTTYWSSETALYLETLPFMALMDRCSRQRGLECLKSVTRLKNDLRTFLRAIATFPQHRPGFRRSANRPTLEENETGWMDVDVDDDEDGSPGGIVPEGRQGGIENGIRLGTVENRSCFVVEDDIEEF